MFVGRPGDRSIGEPVLATFTFKENIVDSLEREKRWRRLKARMLRRWPCLVGCGAWQRQKRGAWHAHIVINQWVEAVELRQMCLDTGFGTFLDLKPVSCRDGFRNMPGSPGQHLWRCCRYVTRYLVRDVGRDPGERTGIFFGDLARSCTVRFAWTNGLSRLWRIGCREFFDVFGEVPSWRNATFVMRFGWECASAELKAELLKSQSIKDFLDAPYIDSPF
jgi:hypothetical protein